MFPRVETKDPAAVQLEVQAAYLAMFPEGGKLFVPQIFGWAIDCFTGQYADYQAIDALYHDFEHTLQGALCMARLLRSRHIAQAQPVLSRRLFELGMLAILLHDTGYLKKRDDTVGTGAKYTVVHVRRSADFAEELLKTRKFAPADIQAVKNMILCTGVNAALETIPFQGEIEKIVGFALASADLLGQMAADDYVEKLPVLYAEFSEAAALNPDRANVVNMFASAEDLRRKTPAFWEKFVLGKLNHEFQGVYRYLSDPYPNGPNYYVDAIEANIRRLKKEIQRES